MSTKKRLTNNLVVMGSAAVVAVYAAGYVRTAAAAEKFAEMSDERGPLPTRKSVTSDAKAAPVAMTSRANRAESVASSDVGGVTASTTSSSAAGQSNATAASNPIDRQKNGSISATGRAPTSTPVIAATPPVAVANNTAHKVQTDIATSGTQPVVQNANSARNAQPFITAPKQTAVVSPAPINNAPAPAVTAPTVVTPAAPAAVPTPSPAVAVTAPVSSATNVPPASPELAAKSAPTVADAKPPLPPGVKYRDGEYYGWGTSRHGDIQAYVEVTDGKVSYVKIAQCLTQYSCGLIDVLPGQVFTRNGPEIDSVSGATQSSNAFFYAVQQALSKAK